MADSKRGSGRKGIIDKYGDQSDEGGEATQRRKHPEGFGINGEAVAHAPGKHIEGYGAVRLKESQPSSEKGLLKRDSSRINPNIWLPEPNVGRVANGIPNRSHRLKALGNAVVPRLVAEIGRIVMEFDQRPC